MDFKKYVPFILSGIAVVGVGVTAYLGAKCHEKALPEIIKKKEEKGDISKVELTKAVWKHYIPVMVSAGATVTCIILSNAISAKELAAMTAVASAAIAQKNKIIKKAKETLGEEKWKEVEKDIAKDEVKKKMDEPHKHGEVIFFDPFTNYSFYSDLDTVKEAIYRINRILALEGRANLADFYDLMHQRYPWFAKEYGWSVQKGLEEGRYCWIDIEIDAIKDDSGDSSMYYCINYIEPSTDYELEGYKDEEYSAVERAYQEQYYSTAC